MVKKFKTLKKENQFLKIEQGELTSALVPMLYPEYISFVDIKNTYKNIDFEGVYFELVTLSSTL
jgi:hypothetical protein